MAVAQNNSAFDRKIALYTRSESQGARRLRQPTPDIRKYLFVSVDDHLCEPPETFEGRLPAKFADRGPRVEREDGVDYWNYEGERIPLTVSDGRQTWDPSDWDYGNITFDGFRPGIYDIHARIKDMDLGGCYASLNFPSILIGFCGQRFMRMQDKELGLACMRAYNDWIFEGWYGPYPDRIIPSQITWLLDAEIAAAEIYRNAARGFKAVAFSENPEKLGLPSIHSGAWDPFFRACEETETVINLHIGSSSSMLMPSTDSPVRVAGALFTLNAQVSFLDWVFSQVVIKFPNIKIAYSEGGISWVPGVLDRFRHYDMNRVSEFSDRDVLYDGPPPDELLHRNFWFCSIYDPSALQHRHTIGIDRIMMEMDYPHNDSTWPHPQKVLDDQIGDFPKNEQEKLTYLNACALYRHPLPSMSFLGG